MGIKLIKPAFEYKEQILKCRDKLLEANSGFEGCLGLNRVSTFEEWMEFDKRLRKEYGSNYVQSKAYIAVREDDNKVVGFLDYRTRLNDYLFNFGGHIGYLVMPQYRKMGYATVMLKKALEMCKAEFGKDKILVTCDKSNIASRNTILKCGGTLENEVYEGGTLVQRYWFYLNWPL